MIVKIAISEIFDSVQSHVAMIGKRINDAESMPAFSNLVLSTREREVIAMYVAEAVRSVNAICPERVLTYKDKEDSLSVYIVNGRDSEPKDNVLVSAVKAYVRNFCAAQYLSMAFPEQAKKYITETDTSGADLRNLIFHKEAPSGKVLLTETTGSCE